MPEVPGEFSVVPVSQEIRGTVLSEIEAFIRVFERVTTRPAWQKEVAESSPEIARAARREVCFFSAWDFHLSATQGWQLIEFNDNGSGFLFAGLVNRLFYELANLQDSPRLEPPWSLSRLFTHITDMVEKEAVGFFGTMPPGLFLILDDAESLERGRFRHELYLLRELLHHKGWRSEIAAATETRWEGGRLLWRGQEVSFIVNRSTDFFWRGETFAAVRAAYDAGTVYIAPNPFTYATRSDKRLLEFLSCPDWDEELGIHPEERRVLAAHVPPTHLLRSTNVEVLARQKGEYFFKPLHGFAGRGVLTGAQVGRSRLRRLLKSGEGYVAQRRVPKPVLRAEHVAGGVPLWTDLRVWAYRGQRWLISGRASCQADHLDLTPPGGWLPTYVRV